MNESIVKTTTETKHTPNFKNSFFSLQKQFPKLEAQPKMITLAGGSKCG